MVPPESRYSFKQPIEDVVHRPPEQVTLSAEWLRQSSVLDGFEVALANHLVGDHDVHLRQTQRLP